MAAEKLGYTEESVGRADESALMLSSLPMQISHKLRQFHQHASYMPSLDMKVYQKQTEIILSLAEKGPVSSLDAVPTTYCGTNMTVSMSLSAPKRRSDQTNRRALRPDREKAGTESANRQERKILL